MKNSIPLISWLCLLCGISNVHPETSIDKQFEGLRHLILQQKFLESGVAHEQFKSFFEIEYNVIEDSTIDTATLEYIKGHPNLPGYIKKALIEGHTIETMTIGEFMLVKQKIEKELIICSSRHFPHELHIGYKKYFSKERNFVLGGTVWTFRYGFLWETGKV